MAVARYAVNELAFDVPEGFVDQSTNVLLPTSPAMKHACIVVTRQPRIDAPLGQQVTAILKEAKAKMPALTVLGHREREVGTVPAVEVRAHANPTGKQPTYQRHLYVAWYGTLLTFVVTTTRAQSRDCDAHLERIAATLRLRKKG